MNRDSFLFYKSYYEAIKNLPDSTKLEVYNAVMEYGLYSNEIELHDGFARSIFTLIKPVLETNNKRFRGGKSGGRPRKEKPMVLRNKNQNETYGFENSDKNENLSHLRIKDISSDEDIGYRKKDKGNNTLSADALSSSSSEEDTSGSNPEDTDSPTADAEDVPPNGVEKERKSSAKKKESGKAASEKIDYNAIMRKFNEADKGRIPNIEKMTDARKTAIRTRVKDFGLDSIDRVISAISASDFLKGNDKEGWFANFDWIFKPANYAKILEGNYANKKKKNSYRNSDYWGGQTE